MSDRERTGRRTGDSIYSDWHRRDNIKKYGMTLQEAWSLGMINIDAVEYCRHCGAPLALIETQASDGPPKPAAVTAALANLSGIPAYSVSIVPGDFDPIALFKVKQIAPCSDAIQTMLPRVYAYFLLSLRLDHKCPKLMEAGAA